jgi:GT2 family glycosyltransferase
VDVSVIIVNWNTRDMLRDCLRSVYEQTQQVSFEIVVIDNASQDGSVDMVRREFPAVVLIPNPENRGFAAANNQGMEVAHGRYVLLLNSDTLVLGEALARTVQFADAHPQAAVVGCRVLNPDRSLQPTCFLYPSLLNMVLSSTYLYKLWPRSRFFGRERMTWWDRNDVRDVDVVTGCFMLVRREAIDRVGVMDDHYFVYGEETDWCYRFKAAGWRVLFTPDAEIVHFGGASSRRVAYQMKLQLYGSILRFLRKHRPRVVYSLACLLCALFFLIRVPYWLGRAVVSRGDRRACYRMARTYATGAFRAVRGWESLCVRS